MVVLLTHGRPVAGCSCRRCAGSSTAGDVAASALYVVNWRLAGQAVNYLAQGEDPSPVQHFWSLAVEEQFYVLWPLLLIVAAIVVRRRGWSPSPRAARAIIVTLSVPSFIYSLQLTHSQPGAAYFSSLTRAWELGVGAALAIVAPWLGPAALDVQSRPRLGGARRRSSGRPSRSPTPHRSPGSAALWPVLGAAAVIAAGVTAGQERAGTPARHAADDARRPHLVLLVPLALAAAGHRRRDLGPPRGLAGRPGAGRLLRPDEADHPLRRGPVPPLEAVLVEFPRRAFGLAAVTMSSVLVASYLLRGSVPQRRPSPLGRPRARRRCQECCPVTATTRHRRHGARREPSVTAAVPEDDQGAAHSARGVHAVAPDRPQATSRSSTPTAASANENERRRQGLRLRRPQRQVTIGLLGDSHAAQWFPRSATDRVGPATTGSSSMTKSGCTPASVLVYNPDPPQAGLHRVQHLANGSHREAGLGEAHSSSWCPGSSATPSCRTASSSRRSPASPRRRAGMAATLKPLTAAGSKVLVLRDTPRARASTYPSASPAPARSLTKCASARAKASMTAASTGVEQAAAELTKGATYVDLDNSVCPSDPCPPIIGNVLVYRDTDHMTATYAATLEPPGQGHGRVSSEPTSSEDAAHRRGGGSVCRDWLEFSSSQAGRRSGSIDCA